MDGKNLTQPPANPSEPKHGHAGRALVIFAATLLGLIVLVALAIVVLGKLGRLSGTPGRINEEPAWSPDGHQIAFTSDRGGNDDIYVMSSDGSHVRQLTSNTFALLNPFPGSADDYAPAWSPDGKQIAFVSGRDNSAWSFVDTDIFIMDANGQNAVEWEGSQANTKDEFPEWSPDGCCIIYSSSPAANTGGIVLSDILMASIKPAGNRSVTDLTLREATNADPSWSPDRNHIAYAAYLDQSWHLFLMNKNGLERVQLTSGSNSEYSPAWSPDGSRVAYTCVIGDKADIFVMDADGSHVSQLTHSPSNSFLPAWSPDGSRIAFVSDQTGNTRVRNIYVMNADGSNIVQLTK